MGFRHLYIQIYIYFIQKQNKLQKIIFVGGNIVDLKDFQYEDLKRLIMARHKKKKKKKGGYLSFGYH